MTPLQDKPQHGCDGSIEVWDCSTEPARYRRYTVAPCPFCLPADRPHFEFALCELSGWGRDPEPVPDAIHCGGCGLQGPWGRTELEAVEKWNLWNGTTTTPLGDWRTAAPHDPNSPDLPF